MSYRWKKTLEAVQLPGELEAADSTGIALTAKKGDWLVFEEGKYIGCFNDKQFKDRTEMVAAPRKQRSKVDPQTATNGEMPKKRGRKPLGRSPLQDESGVSSVSVEAEKL